MSLRLRPEVEAAFAAALEVPEAEQQAFVARECLDPAVRAEVETLLRNHWAAGGFMEQPAVPGLPARIGRYRIVRLLGEGGMGLVYEAEQDQPCRTVALKVIKGAFAGPEVLRRFEGEAQALGRLQHPGIAQIYEAGTADSGFGPQPYFAMEFIRGVSLLRYADAHRLSTRERLELMAKICAAVHHAHQRGIIHRDLKPGNILVDEAAQPKVLDFGVACATDREGQATRHTGLGQLVGTLEYMSPEQVLADPLHVDTRTDVYALGVILFELLAGRLPYQLGAQLHEAVQTIRESSPVRLSAISRAYRGDIETIAAKALEKDKERRYPSAAELGADIERYLRDEPIVARPPGTAYQLRKFARRHKAVVSAAAAVFVALSAGVVVSTREAVRAQRAEQVALRERDRAAAAERRATVERDRAVSAEREATAGRERALAEQRRADTEAAAARAIDEFLQNDLLAQAGATAQARPGAKPDPDLKVRTALDRAAARIEGKFEKQPLVEASIRHTIGISYKDLGLYAQAQQQLERAVEIRKRVLGERDPEALRSMSELALVYRYAGKYPAAEALGTRVLELRRSVLGKRHRETLSSMNNLIELFRSRGMYARAEALGEELLRIRRGVLGPEHPDTLESMNNLGLLYLYEGKYALAEPLFTKAVEAERRIAGEDHPEAMIATNNLAILYYRQGKYAQAGTLLDRLSRLQSQILGETHPSTLLSVSNLAMVQLRLGRFQAAERLYTNVLEARRRVLGPEHPSTLTSGNTLALTYLAEGKLAEARALIDSVLEVKRRVLGEEHPETLNSMHTLGLLYLDEENFTAAEPLLVKLLAAQRRVMGEAHPDTLNTMGSLARLYFSERRSGEAEAFARKHLDGRSRTLGPEHPGTLAAMMLLGRVLLAERRYGEAEVLLRRALSGLEKTSPGGWERYDTESLLGATLESEGRLAEAEPLLAAGDSGLVQVKDTIPWESRDVLKESAARIARLHHEEPKLSKF